MFHIVTVRTLAIAALGWLLAGEAAALTLGPARGAALIGRPLEVSIPVTLDGRASDVPCASGELFYGEQKIGRAPTLRWEPGPGNQGVLRVSSPAPVDEPMVTLHLRVGCAQGTTRSYVLLAELPPAVETTPSSRSVAGPVTPPVAGVPQAQGPAGASSPGSANTSPRRRDAEGAGQAGPGLRTERGLGVARPGGRDTEPALSTPARRRDAEGEASKPRLRLEPLELGALRDPILRLTSALGSQVAADPQRRAGAAALWLALQKTPDEALRDAIRLEGVERELNSLRDVTRQNAAAVTQMRQQVEQARGGRDTASLLVLVLAVLLALLLAWLAWRWHRVRQVERVGRWFQAHGESVQPPLPAAAGSKETASVASAAGAGAGAAIAVAGASRAAPSPAPPLSNWGAGDEFQASRGGSVRMVGVDELIDVHDKADFFLSIGEHDQAIAVLEAHVHDQVETSALAWMDLLELYHSLGKRAEYERARGEFRQRFTAQVPEFDYFDQPTASLENYSRALSRIVALWPSRRVLDVIEESIFRKPGLPGAEPFSLEAYRELVLLYHVARDVAPAQEEAQREPGSTGFSDTLLQPLNNLDRPEPTQADRDLLLIPPASSRLGVDIDLGDLGEHTEDEVQVAAQGEAQGEEQRALPPLDFDISGFEEAREGDTFKRG